MIIKEVKNNYGSKCYCICDRCGKGFWRKKSHAVKAKNNYCSQACRIGKRNIYKCDYCGKEFKRKKSQVLKYEHNYCNKKCSNKGQSKFLIGENAGHWMGGITDRSKRVKKEYREWKKKVFGRDDYTCQICGNNKKIVAHHIKSFTDYPELAHNINNGITLCEKCHKEIHWGNKEEKELCQYI